MLVRLPTEGGKYIRICVCLCMLSCSVMSHSFETSWTVVCQVPLSVGFSRQKYCTGFHFLFHGIFPTQGSNPTLLQPLHWQTDSLPLNQLGSPIYMYAAAKSLQSRPTLCDPIDGSPTGSPVPGILQARTLEWVAISFSNA